MNDKTRATGSNPVLGGGGFHHVCVKTRDWDATQRFYRDALGCVEKIAWRAAPQRAVLLDTGDGNYLEVFEDLAYQPAPNGSVVHFALRTTRLDAVVDRLSAAGVKVTLKPKDAAITPAAGGVAVPIRIAFCEGPSGEVIELFQNDRL